MLKKILSLSFYLISLNLLCIAKDPVTAIQIEMLKNMESSKDRFLEYIKLPKVKSGTKPNSTATNWVYYGTNSSVGEEAIFKEDLELSSYTFYDFDASGATFNGGVFCTAVNFKNDTTFEGANFKGYLKFEGATFNGSANFSDCVFENTCDFVLASFNKETIFDNSIFGQKIYFHQSIFNQKATFYKCKFKEIVDFLTTKFLWDVSFENSTFQQIAKFRFTKFSKTTQFNNCLFVQQADFFAAIFGGRTDFSNASFQQEATFRWAKFNSGSQLSFNNSNPNQPNQIITFNAFANFKYSNLVNMGSNASFNGATYTSEENIKYIPQMPPTTVDYRKQMINIGGQAAKERYAY